jgi:hypothetical protein
MTKQDENIPMAMKVKKLKIFLRYYVSNLRRWIFTLWPLVLFIISILLFLAILVPNFAHRLPILGVWPKEYELSGSVLQRVQSDNNDLVKLQGAKIEIGGYSSLSNQDGLFDIKFVSESSTGIPVIIVWSDRAVIKRISFEPGQFQKTEVFIVNEN